MRSDPSVCRCHCLFPITSWESSIHSRPVFDISNWMGLNKFKINLDMIEVLLSENMADPAIDLRY